MIFMPVYQHYGLFFSAEQIETALKNRDHEPFKPAFALLNQPPNPPDVVSSTFLHALRYRVEQDLQAGAYALSELQSGVGLDGSDNHLADLLRAVALAQVFEM